MQKCKKASHDEHDGEELIKSPVTAESREQVAKQKFTIQRVEEDNE